MVTSYTIEVGYNSNKDRSESELALRSCVEHICHRPECILDEVERIEGVRPSDVFAEVYRLPWQDLTIRFRYATTPDERFAVCQCASGGSESRDSKESMRRAMIRLVMEEMHRQKIEISVYVN